jgi:hypothetical protein
MKVRRFTPRATTVAMCGALMLLAAIPAVASASPEWYVNGSKVTTSQAITETGTTTLKEGDIGISITCNVSKAGTVGHEGSSEITKWTFSSCAQHGLATCESPGLTAGVTPGSTWIMGLTAVGTEIHDLISGTQRSSIKVKCNGTGTTDECIDVPAAFLENHGLNVKAKYVEGKDEKFECNETKKGEAVLTGSEEIATTVNGAPAVLSVK